MCDGTTGRLGHDEQVLDIAGDPALSEEDHLQLLSSTRLAVDTMHGRDHAGRWISANVKREDLVAIYGQRSEVLHRTGMWSY